MHSETKASEQVDYTLVVTADEETQRRRVLNRPGMTEEKFLAIKAKQMPDSEKRRCVPSPVSVELHVLSWQLTTMMLRFGQSRRLPG